jgi:hypothetical protein
MAGDNYCRTVLKSVLTQLWCNVKSTALTRIEPLRSDKLSHWVAASSVGSSFGVWHPTGFRGNGVGTVADYLVGIGARNDSGPEVSDRKNFAVAPAHGKKKIGPR